MPIDEARELLERLVEAMDAADEEAAQRGDDTAWSAAPLVRMLSVKGEARAYLARTAPEGREEETMESGWCEEHDIGKVHCLHIHQDRGEVPRLRVEQCTCPKVEGRCPHDWIREHDPPPRSSARGAREADPLAGLGWALKNKLAPRVDAYAEALTAERVRERDREWARAFGMEPDNGTWIDEQATNPGFLAEYLAERHRIDVEERVREALEKAAGNAGRAVASMAPGHPTGGGDYDDWTLDDVEEVVVNAIRALILKETPE